MHRRRLLMTALAAAPVLAFAPHAMAATPTWVSHRFSVVVEGSGPDVILIPGLTSSRTVYDGIAAHLRGRFRLHRIQLAGFAGAPVDGNAQGDVVAPMVEDLAAYIASQKLDRPAVVGHSLGGEAGLMLAARHPEAVGRLLVIDSLPFISVLFFGPSATPDTVRPQADAIRNQMIAQSQEDYAKSEQGFIATLSKTEAARPGLIDQAVSSDRSVVARAMHDLMVTDVTPELPRITAPTTVLYAYDKASYGVPAAMADGLYQAAYAKLKGVKLVRVDDSLHFIMIDQPQAFETQVDAFLA